MFYILNEHKFAQTGHWKTSSCDWLLVYSKPMERGAYVGYLLFLVVAARYRWSLTKLNQIIRCVTYAPKLIRVSHHHRTYYTDIKCATFRLIFTYICHCYTFWFVNICFVFYYLFPLYLSLTHFCTLTFHPLYNNNNTICMCNSKKKYFV